MNPDHFQQAKRIYSAALELEAAQRELFVATACAGNEDLRAEVAALLACRTEAADFFHAPALEAAAKGLARESRTEYTGRTVSHYAVLEKIGEGGMGVVYKARDTHLGRLIALKILPFATVDDPERKRRFIQEARAASALNHPNIVTIHDIDEADDVTFIAMEYVNGRTLERLLAGGPLAIDDILHYAVQIADALVAAHTAGIVHRDIKPANIIVTDSSMVKVLDFGVAKLMEREIGLGPATGPGVILGTVAYMSPEQAEGKDVDARSDIFSLGSLLYEMTTGKRAFDRDSQASTIASILRDQPKPLRQVARKAPQQLERLVERCMRKEPERRFQTMVNLKTALEQVRPRHMPPVVSTRKLAFGVAVILLAAAFGLTIWLARRQSLTSVAPIKVSLLAGLPGRQWSPALSPDGKQIAFAWSVNRPDQHNIYVQLVGDAVPRQLTSGPVFEYSPAWSPDALHIAFLRETPEGTKIVLIPAAGGMERTLHLSKADCRLVSRVFARMACGVAWSPDGKYLAFVDKDSPESANSVYLLDVDTLATRKLTTPPYGFDDGSAAFSPNGRMVAFSRRADLPPSDIYVLALSKDGRPRGDPRQLTHDQVFILGLDWTENGNQVVFSSSRGGVFALWEISASGGEPRRLPFGAGDAYWPSLSRKGGRLAFASGTIDQNIWRVEPPGSPDTGGAGTPLRITPSPMVDQDAVFSPDGTKVAYISTHSGSHQIWLCESDGSRPMQLTDLAPPGADAAEWSPDGLRIAFRGNASGRHAYVIGADRSGLHRLTTGDFEEDPPTWSRDGRWLYFSSNRGNGSAIWKARAEGSAPVLVWPAARWPVVSPDGKFLYFSNTQGIWMLPAAGGSAVLTAPQGHWPFYQSSDGKFLYYSGRDAAIWKTSLEKPHPARLLDRGERGRALWTLSSTAIFLLDPDSNGGPTLSRFSLAGTKLKSMRLPGSPDPYAEAFGDLSASPGGRWLLYPRLDRDESVLMLVENLRER